MKRKLTALLLCCCILFGLSACGEKQGDAETVPVENTNVGYIIETPNPEKFKEVAEPIQPSELDDCRVVLAKNESGDKYFLIASEEYYCSAVGQYALEELKKNAPDTFESLKSAKSTENYVVSSEKLSEAVDLPSDEAQNESDDSETTANEGGRRKRQAAEASNSDVDAAFEAVSEEIKQNESDKSMYAIRYVPADNSRDIVRAELYDTVSSEPLFKIMEYDGETVLVAQKAYFESAAGKSSISRIEDAVKTQVINAVENRTAERLSTAEGFFEDQEINDYDFILQYFGTAKQQNGQNDFSERGEKFFEFLNASEHADDKGALIQKLSANLSDSDANAFWNGLSAKQRNALSCSSVLFKCTMLAFIVIFILLLAAIIFLAMKLNAALVPKRTKRRDKDSKLVSTFKEYPCTTSEPTTPHLKKNNNTPTVTDTRPNHKNSAQNSVDYSATVNVLGPKVNPNNGISSTPSWTGGNKNPNPHQNTITAQQTTVNNTHYLRLSEQSLRNRSSASQDILTLVKIPYENQNPGNSPYILQSDGSIILNDHYLQTKTQRTLWNDMFNTCAITDVFTIRLTNGQTISSPEQAGGCSKAEVYQPATVGENSATECRINEKGILVLM